MHPEIMEAVKRVGLDKKWAEEYREECREECHLEVAREMFLDGENLEKIARYTKIPIDRLKQVLYHQ